MYRAKTGAVLVQALVLMFVSTVVITGLMSTIAGGLRATERVQAEALALTIAEAGVEYYRWHLAHSPNDFTDGTGEPGPYVHEYSNRSGEVIGNFSLDIVAPINGSTLVEISSTGTVNTSPNSPVTVQVILAKPSVAQYAVVSDAAFQRFGEGTTVYGPIHSNGGIQFDGVIHNVITSSVETVYNPDYGQTEYGVHTKSGPDDPQPPTELPVREDVFKAGREFPVAPIDFDGFTTTFSQMKTVAENSNHYYGDSGWYGYLLRLRNDNKYEVYKVRSLQSGGWFCYGSDDDWDEWSYRESGLEQVGTYDLPTDGVIFFADHVWVEGEVDGARVTIAAARFPDVASERKNIIINRDLTYSGDTDVIGLLAQNNINVGYFSEDDLEIDAALIAQHGRVGRHHYSGWCSGSYHIRDTITLQGMIGTRGRYGFAYTDGTGYAVRNLLYDNDLLYSPPPYFPVTNDNYEIIRWEIVE